MKKRIILFLVRSLQLVGFFILPIGWLVKESQQWLGPYPIWLQQSTSLLPSGVFEPLILVIIAIAGGVSWYYKKLTDPNSSTLPQQSILASTPPASSVITKLSITQDGIFNLHLHGQQLPHFIGRADLLKELVGKLTADGPALKVLQGIDGIGKTQLALEFGYHPISRALFNDGIWLVRASNPAILEEDLLQFSNALLSYQDKDPEVFSVPERIEYLFSFLRGHYTWLLILDDVKDPVIISRFLRGLNGSILITSDYPHWEQTLTADSILSVPKLDSKDSCELLQRLSNSTITPALAENITRKLEHLPLFIELFAEDFNHEQDHLIKALKKSDTIDASGKQFFRLVIVPLYQNITGPNKTRLSFLSIPYSSAVMTTLFLLSLFDDKRIPISAFTEILKEAVFYQENEQMSWWSRLGFRIFHNNRPYYKSLAAQNKIFQRLLNRSIIQVNDEQTISIDPAYRRALFFFTSELLESQPRIQQYNLNSFVEYVYNIFRFTKDIQLKEGLLPHVISLTNNLREINIHPPYLLRLARYTSSYLQQELLYTSANYFSEYVYEQEKTSKGKVEIATIEDRLSNATQSFQTVVFNNLLEDLKESTDEDSYFYYQVALAINHIQLFQMDVAADYLIKAINLVENNADEADKLSQLQLFLAFALSSIDKPASIKALSAYKKHTTEEEKNAPSNSVLFLQAATFGNLASIIKEGEKVDEDQQKEWQSLSLTKYDQLLSQEEIAAPFKSLVRIDLALLAFNLNDTDTLESMATHLSSEREDFFHWYRENPLAIGEYYLVQGIHLGVQEEYDEARHTLHLAIAYYDQVFDGHTYRTDFASALIEKIETLE